MGLMLESGIDVTVVPNLYDIKPDSTSMLALSSIKGNMVVISWMFERASHWILDRNNIVGHVGKVLLEYACLLYTSPSPRDKRQSRMPSSA